MTKGENIYKRKDGRWEGRYKKGHDKDRKIQYGYCYGHSYRETKEKLNRAKAEFMLNRPSVSKDIYKKNLADYCVQWLKINENRLKRSTLAKYNSMLEKHIKPQLGDYPLTDLDSDIIADFSNDLLYQKQLSVKTVRDILIFIHKIIDYIQADPQNNLPFIVISYPKTERKETRILSAEEQKNLTQYLLQDFDVYKFSVLLALFTGLRIGEICALQWKDISVDSGFLMVKHTVQRIKNLHGQSESKTVLQLGAPKTSSSARIIPIANGLIGLFRIFQTDDPEAFVITGNRQFTDPRKLQRKLKKYTEELGLRGVHFHTLRHTYATRCLEFGCDTKILSEMLGHANISTTMNRYVHPSMEFKRESIFRLEQTGFFPPSMEPSNITENPENKE